MRRKKLNFILAMFLTICMILTFSSQAFAIKSLSPKKNTLSVYAMDVGQGSSYLVVTPKNKVMLIDTGTKGASKSLIADLKKLGIKRIDALVATHPHSDHIGGMLKLFDAFEIKQVYMPKVEHTSKLYVDMLEYFYDNDIKIKSLVGGKNKFLELDNTVKIQVLAPLGKKYKNLNDYSAAFRIQYGKASVLITGDNQAISEKEIVKEFGNSLSSDVLFVGHHGSKTSSTQDFLNKVNPKYAIISCGKENSYGHPHDVVMKRLKKKKAEIYRTDQDGTVAVFITKNKCDVKCK